MSITVTVGKTASFVVHCHNAAGTDVPDTNGPITVSVDNALAGSATCHPDGTNGVFTALLDATQTCNIVATDGTLTSAPYPVTLAADVAPATLTVAAT